MSLIKNYELTCPVSFKRVNENVVRLIAALVVLIAAISVILQSYILAIALAIDFLFRATDNELYSPLRWVASKIAALLSLPNKPIVAEPKKFSALLGFMFSVIIGFLLFFQLPFYANITAGILFFCAILESGLGICLGCYVYIYAIAPYKTKD